MFLHSFVPPSRIHSIFYFSSILFYLTFTGPRRTHLFPLDFIKLAAPLCWPGEAKPSALILLIYRQLPFIFIYIIQHHRIICILWHVLILLYHTTKFFVRRVHILQVYRIELRVCLMSNLLKIFQRGWFHWRILFAGRMRAFSLTTMCATLIQYIILGFMLDKCPERFESLIF